MTESWDAVVVGSGPNGLAAGITLAQAGRSVLVLEGADEIGGGLRSDMLSGGLVRDRCAAVMPFAVGSPFLSTLDLAGHGLQWAHPEVQYTQPLDGGRAGAALRDLNETADLLGSDGKTYRRLVQYLVGHWADLAEATQGPLATVPRHPMLLARYGFPGLRSSDTLAGRFGTDEAKSMIAGCAAHSVLPLDAPLTAAIAAMFAASAHAVGWPVVVGGSSGLAAALASVLRSLGGEIRTGHMVGSLEQLPDHRAVLFDIDPAQVEAICGDALPHRYRRRLNRYQFGPGVFKLDHVLDGPVPWADPFSARSGTVHVGGTFEESAAAEAEVAAGRHPERPFVLVAQQDVADPSRVIAGRHTLWSYTHVPNGSTIDRTEAIESQIERYAPGFRDRIVERHTMTSVALQEYNPAYVGGDITGGSFGHRQLFVRPRLFRPYQTPNDRVFLCGASTPPGGGVHGMAGHHGAKAALRSTLK